MKTYSLDMVKDKYLGKVGTSKRDAYENELRIDLLGEAIKPVELLNEKLDLTEPESKL